jgi:hypothetical protein
MYDVFIKWIGSKSCTLAGQVTEVLDAGTACAASQSWNVGVAVLSLVALSATVSLINERRRRYRENFYR